MSLYQIPDSLSRQIAELEARIKALETAPPTSMAALTTTGLMDHPTPSPYVGTDTEIPATRTPNFVIDRPRSIFVVAMAQFWADGGDDPYVYLRPIVESTSALGTPIASAPNMVATLTSPIITTDGSRSFWVSLQPGTYCAAFQYHVNTFGAHATQMAIAFAQIDVYLMGN